jgi:membrane-associated phospholipid phosphatase
MASEASHYRRLPAWRYVLRKQFLFLIRKEVPLLESVQTLRNPFLDSYFTLTANLGTHTFFMVLLPILHWTGNATLFRAFVHVLGIGVYLSCFLKDLLCLPRPPSPPLHRITMSGSAALEYGFPSTHSTNAISLAVYMIHWIRNMDATYEMRFWWEIATWIYGLSIVVGRIYCGMHGFVDVAAGCLVGAAISLCQISLESQIDYFTFEIKHPYGILILLTVILLLIYLFPEPVDECPCFDDAVAFSGVLFGAEWGIWVFADSPYAWSNPPATVPYDAAQLGVIKSFLRIVVGVAVIFSWRATMKPILIRSLPPVYRAIELGGWDLPRRFFVRASQYSHLESKQLDDHTLPDLKDIPAIIHKVRRTRSLSDSVGPQSSADLYELNTLTRRRRDGTQKSRYEAIETPRTRYDVEVVTKLVVYGGIAFLTIVVCPYVFEKLGLGMGQVS